MQTITPTAIKKAIDKATKIEMAMAAAITHPIPKVGNVKKIVVGIPMHVNVTVTITTPIPIVTTPDMVIKIVDGIAIADSAAITLATIPDMVIKMVEPVTTPTTLKKKAVRAVDAAAKADVAPATIAAPIPKKIGILIRKIQNYHEQTLILYYVCCERRL